MFSRFPTFALVMLLFQLVLFTSLAYLCWKYYLRLKPTWDISSKTDNLKPFTLSLKSFGLLKMFWCDKKDLYQVWRSCCEGFNSFSFGHLFIFIPRDPEHVKIILNSQEAFEKPFHYDFFFDSGLLIIGGDRYKQQRRALNPLFYPSNLKSLIPLLNVKTGEFINSFEQFFGLKNVDIKNAGLHFVANTIFATVFGAEPGSFQHIQAIIDNFDRYASKVSQRIMQPWMFSDLIYRLTNDYKQSQQLLANIKYLLRQNFDTCMKKAEVENVGKYFEFMNNYATKESWTSQNFLDDFTILFFGSFDTSGQTIAHILLLLAMNPECQEKLYNEIKSVLATPDDEVTEDHMNAMHYLNLIIKESMRLIPAVLILSRQVTKPLKLGNYTLPTDTNLSIWVRELHTDIKLWGDDAYEFKPERFLEENISKVHPYAYIPFSNGPRICPGYKYANMSLKIFVSRFLMKYRVSTQLKYDDLNYVFGVTMKIKENLIVNIEPR